MINEDNLSGKKPEISDKKINTLYKLMKMFKKPNIVANVLNVDKRTFASWISKGNEYLEKNREFSLELSDCILDAIIHSEEYMQSNEEFFKQEFMQETYSDGINGKNFARYAEWRQNKLHDFIEDYTSKSENELINSYKFHEIDSKDETIKKYIKVARIVSRANNSNLNKYLEYVDKHAGTAKNVTLAKWLIETLEPEEFKPEQNRQQNTLINNGTISLIGLAKQEQLTTRQQDEEIIDADYTIE